MNQFLIGTGYHATAAFGPEQQFAHIWLRNLKRYCPRSDSVVAITTGHEFPLKGMGIQQIRTSNLGHIGDLLHSRHMSRVTCHTLCGWSASVLALCLIAYNDQRDLVYLEQDALAFGPWLEQAYADLGEAQMVFGRKHETTPFMPCSQSLFIIRHQFLLEFVARYLALPPDAEMNPEGKFHELEARDPASFARLSFGVDRERPIPFDAPVFYAQRWTGEEVEEARKRGLL